MLRKVSETEYYKYTFRPPAPPEGPKFGENNLPTELEKEFQWYLNGRKS